MLCGLEGIKKSIAVNLKKQICLGQYNTVVTSSKSVVYVSKEQI